MAASKVAVFLDYQNVHLMAHGLFMPHGTPVQDALVHPLRVAERLVAKRREDSELSSVRVFRGRPNSEHQPTLAAANDAQTAAWERQDPRLRVIRRDLNYRDWPAHPPREKGAPFPRQSEPAATASSAVKPLRAELRTTSTCPASRRPWPVGTRSPRWPPTPCTTGTPTNGASPLGDDGFLCYAVVHDPPRLIVLRLVTGLS